MLKKANRLQKEKDFKSVFRLSKPVYCGNLGVRAAKLKSNDSRFGFVINNKIEKKATRRNALRRKMRAIAQELLPGIQGNFSIVIVVTKPYEFPYNFDLIRREMKSGLEKCNVRV